MEIDLTKQGINGAYRADKKVIVLEDVPEYMFTKYKREVNKEDDIFIFSESSFINKAWAPCPEGSCSKCLFAVPCTGDNVPLMVKALEHLYQGGEITWKN